MISPDDVTIQYLAGRPYAPSGPEWDAAVRGWRTLRTDDAAVFDRQLTMDAGALEPMISFGTSPGMTAPVSARVPDPARITDPSQRNALAKAIGYMGFVPGQSLLGHPIDVVFIGSCTNGRLADLRDAARILNGHKVNPKVKTVIVPGSRPVMAAARSEGLDEIFLAAGAEWREPGCSMCIAMNGDQLAPGQYCVSTSNRNFEGRQGKGGRTMLASPLTAAASALAGAVADVRMWMK